MELNQENYETYLLLYIDNELTAPQRAAVEAFLATNPKYSKELKALQNTILAPEAIQYPDKSMLYRFEEMNASLDPAFKKTLYKQTTSTARVIEFKKRYLAYAAIAATVLWIFIGTKQVFNTNSTILSAIEEKPMKSSQSIVDNKSPLNQAPTIAAVSIKTRIVKNTTRSINEATENIINSTPNTNIFEPEAIAEHQQAPITEDIHPINVTQENNSSLVPEVKVEKETFEEIHTEDNDRVLYISNIELDGDKFRGITRKLGAIFKRNKTEKNK